MQQVRSPVPGSLRAPVMYSPSMPSPSLSRHSSEAVLPSEGPAYAMAAAVAASLANGSRASSYAPPASAPRVAISRRSEVRGNAYTYAPPSSATASTRRLAYAPPSPQAGW
ncbi:unnamed protein product [Polarella glacialis]|nr:unnamed protein product [Polarella glacialis]